jgi:hypothetical protein
VASDSGHSDQDVETKVKPPTKPVSKAASVNKPASKRPQPKPAYKGAKSKATSSEKVEVEEENDVEVMEPAKKTRKGPSEKSKGKRKAELEEVESDVEVIERKGKRKVQNTDDGDTGTVKKQKVMKTGDENGGRSNGGANNSVEPPKKKRKINLFPASQTPTMPWGQFAQVWT